MNLRLRCFNQFDGIKIAEWVCDPDYETFFRNNAVIPTREECMNYPAWSQNIVTMVDIMNDKGEWQTIGMACGYHPNYRNKTVKAGLIIQKELHRNGLGHAAMTKWIDTLFKRMAFRKVIVENVHEHLTKGYELSGFKVEGRHVKEVMLNGEWKDEIRMACFDTDWKIT